jgi:hypothetical protein
VVPVTFNGLNVSFSLSNVEFDGHITRTALVGSLGRESVSLRRGKSYWQ